MRALYLLLVAFSMIALCAADIDPVVKTVDYLIAQVEKSDCKFIRNGDEHTAKEAAEHMRAKYNHFKKKIKTPEDFIQKCASKSELSGKPYLVKKPDGSAENCEDWMKNLLADHQKTAAAATVSK